MGGDLKIKQCKSELELYKTDTQFQNLHIMRTCWLSCTKSLVTVYKHLLGWT